MDKTFGTQIKIKMLLNCHSIYRGRFKRKCYVYSGTRQEERESGSYKSPLLYYKLACNRSN